MQITNGTVSFSISPNDRPFIKFRRTLNKGTQAREERRDEKGKVTRAAHPGQFEEDWEKPLISHRAPYDPYTWVTPEWALRRIEVGYKPIAYGNLDKLPAGYPAEWRAKIAACINAVAATCQANARVIELEGKLNEQGIKAPTVSGSEELPGSPDQGVQKTSRRPRQTANHAAS